MINKSILNRLNKCGFGSDIDALESYVISSQQAKPLSNFTKYKKDYENILALLEKVKPESTALKEINQLDIDIKIDDNLKHFNKYKNKQIQEVYGSNDRKGIENIVNALNNYSSKMSDLVAMINIEGINVEIVYIKGQLDKIYTIGVNTIYSDLTTKLKHLLPEEIAELRTEEIAEFRGIITIPLGTDNNLAFQYNNAITSTMQYLRTDTHLDKLSILITNSFISDDKNYYNNQWEKIQFLIDCGFNVPINSMIRNIDKKLLTSALKEFNKYFNRQQSNYSVNGFVVKTNSLNSDTNIEENILCITDNVKSEKIFKASVKKIEIEKDLTIKINIEELKCNDNLTITSVQLSDIFYLDKIRETNTVEFYINKGEPIALFNQQEETL